jgi:hypothetical protein
MLLLLSQMCIRADKLANIHTRHLLFLLWVVRWRNSHRRNNRRKWAFSDSQYKFGSGKCTHIASKAHPVRVGFPTRAALNLEGVVIRLFGGIFGTEVGDTVSSNNIH